jgi:hypothetical protein
MGHPLLFFGDAVESESNVKGSGRGRPLYMSNFFHRRDVQMSQRSEMGKG